MTVIDPARLARALELRVELVGDYSALVSGGAAPHLVEKGTCDCADDRFHDGPCKHRLATYLARRLDCRVLVALFTLVVGAESPSGAEAVGILGGRPTGRDCG